MLNFSLRTTTKGPPPCCLPQGLHHPRSTPGLSKQIHLDLQQIVYRLGNFTVHPPGSKWTKFSNSENCCGSENAMLPKFLWDMEGDRGNFR